MAQAKDLNYYLANPDEMPDDIAQLASSLESPEEAATETKEDVKSATSSTEAAQEEVTAEAEKEHRLLSKNGKDEIPYQVLVTERERRSVAEKAAEELRQQLADIQAQVRAPQKEEPQAQPEVTDDTLQQISEDFPQIGKVIGELQAQIESAKRKVMEVEQVEERRRAQEAAAVGNKVQEAIDANPSLRYWQNEDAEMFGRAIDFDNILKGDARNRSLTLEQRFEKVVAAMETVYGPAALPDAYKKDEAPRQDMNELTEKATKVVKDAGSFKPKSLSDIPGGSPPAASESEKLENMSASQLAAMFGQMDADQINTMLAKLG